MYRFLLVLGSILFCGLFTTACATTGATTEIEVPSRSAKTSKFWSGDVVNFFGCETYHTCQCVRVRGGERGRLDQPLLDALEDLDDMLAKVQPCFDGSGEGGRKVPWTQLEWQEVMGLNMRFVCGVIPRCQTSEAL